MYTTRAFVYGFVISSFLRNAVEDWYGLERFIVVLRGHWWDIPWWIWPPLILIVWIMFMAVRYSEKLARLDFEKCQISGVCKPGRK